MSRRPKGFAISAVTLAELHYGVLVAPQAERIHRIKRLLAIQRTFTVLRVEEDVAQSYGLIAAAARALDRSPRALVMDLLIAASAHAHGAAVVTRNAEDFRTYGDVVEVIALPPRQAA
ncbi:PIN domain-containing protein [Jiangella gansuensis]|uniref:PIN domain-containing protein n=1 Tax=Jiangella gansuensis TaxID=281473 RepID=UPI0004B38552|nr:PIN domain-containing protein [Jiangella gansuensis]